MVYLAIYQLNRDSRHLSRHQNQPYNHIIVSRHLNVIL